MKTMFKSLLKMMKKDDDAYSIGRVCAVISFVAFLIVSAYLAIKSKGEWQGYTTFSHCCMAYLVVQLCNKGVDFFGAKVEADKKKEDVKNEVK